MKFPPVSVFPFPEAAKPYEAKLQMLSAAMELHQRAAEMHAEGMYWQEQAVRLEQLSELIDDGDAERVRDLFVREELIEIVPGFSAPGGLS